MTHIPQQLTDLAERIERLNEWIGRLMAWMVVLMAAIVVYDVSMRSIFHIGSVALQELEWHLFALVFLLGAAYTYRHDGHVRVEIFYQHFSLRRRAWVNLAGNLLFLLPLCVLVIASSWPFVHNSFLFHESSPDPGGLPFRFLIKSAIPFGFFLLLLQGLADSVRQLNILFGPPETRD
ncbi:MAG: TRAP transporter small permease subunit [Acidiferrobacteraceae bacterium]|jgi:TRAP-type mannitol/chloroaromatic compound transport system permease small subunit